MLRSGTPRLCGSDWYGEKGPDASLQIDITAYWARSGLLSLTRDAGAPPTLPVGSETRDGGHFVSAIVTACTDASAPERFLRYDIASRGGSLVCGVSFRAHFATPRSSRCISVEATKRTYQCVSSLGR